MTANPPTPDAPPAPRWLAPVFFVLLVLPFDPFWFDFEQVRRGMLLLLAGAGLAGLRRLRPVHGEGLLWAFLGCLAASAVIQWGADAWFRDAKTAASFQPWDAGYRLAHWLGLVAVVRLGAATAASAALPLAVVLALTSAFGLLQRVGLGEIAGYGVEREPVSVFGNLNVAAEFTAVAATALAVMLPTLRGPRGSRFAWFTLGLAGAYVVIDGSRSALVALPIGLSLLAILRRRQRGWVPLAVAVAGGAAGLLLDLAPRPEPATLKAQRAEHSRGTATLDVRWEIARSTTKLWAQSPIWGLGPGQFAVHYPRVRTAREIETSSHGRQFPTEVRTAHDDWLELLIDGGLIALVAFAAMLFALQRQKADKAQLLPLFVLLLLMLVRAPLWNAPAAAMAFWFAGTARDGPAVRGWRRVAAIALGLTLAAMALPILIANHFAARWQAAVAAGAQADLGHITTAAQCMPFEPRWQEILTRERLAARDLAGAARDGARALQLRPHHPQLYLNLGEVLAQGNRPAEAEAVARQGLAIDPVHPELRVLHSTVLAQQGKADEAIAAVVEQPHPTLRAQLANHFGDLARACRARQDDYTAGRMLIEHYAIAAIDRLGDRSDEAALAKRDLLRDLRTAMSAAGRNDVRLLVLGALMQLDLGLSREAMALGEQAAKRPPLAPWQRALFGDQLGRLQSFESWQPFFARQ